MVKKQHGGKNEHLNSPLQEGNEHPHHYLSPRGEDEGEGENTPSADADTPLKEGNSLLHPLPSGERTKVRGREKISPRMERDAKKNAR